jgi:hypothetical protein
MKYLEYQLLDDESARLGEAVVRGFAADAKPALSTRLTKLNITTPNVVRVNFMAVSCGAALRHRKRRTTSPESWSLPDALANSRGERQAPADLRVSELFQGRVERQQLIIRRRRRQRIEFLPMPIAAALLRLSAALNALQYAHRNLATFGRLAPIWTHSCDCESPASQDVLFVERPAPS